jgi:hypothetical protein
MVVYQQTGQVLNQHLSRRQANTDNARMTIKKPQSPAMDFIATPQEERKAA